MKILVTGGAGFIGTNLTLRLLADPENMVTVVDDLSTGRLWSDLVDHADGRLKIINADVCGLTGGLLAGVEKLPSVRYDQIYHLACAASPVHYQKTALKTLETAFLGTKRIFDLAAGMRAPVLMTSTSEVYGSLDKNEFSEDDFGLLHAFGPRAMYNMGKGAAEALAYCYLARGARIRIARVFNTYGPFMRRDDGRAVPAFVSAALTGAPIHVYGHTKRALMYIDDLIDGLLALMADDDIRTPVNLGNPTTLISMRELAEFICRTLDSESAIYMANAAPDDPPTRRPNIDLAKRRLGWEPKVDLLDGLKKTITWFRRSDV